MNHPDPQEQKAENQALGCKPADCSKNGDWRDIFYLNAFLPPFLLAMIQLDS